MRLIDADKLKESIEKEMRKAEENTPIYITLECILADIDKQSTVSGLKDERLHQVEISKTPNGFLETYCEGY